MKKFFFLTAFVAAVALAAVSCSKEQIPTVNPLGTEQGIVENQTLEVSLIFDAPEISSAKIYVLDEGGCAISTSTVVIPSDGMPTVVDFVNETQSSAKFLWTEGLQNGDDAGRIALPASSIVTKAGAEPLLLVIRK